MKIFLTSIVIIAIAILGIIISRHKSTYTKSAVVSGAPIFEVQNQKIIALTFDDGPYGDATTKVLDILKEKNIKATFFVVGKNVEKYPDLLRREVAEGHIIGNHSYDHSKSLTFLQPKQLLENLQKAENSIHKVIELNPHFFRPPYGLETPQMKTTIEKQGYIVSLWTDSTTDYMATYTSNNIAKNIIENLKPGGIILLHDGRDTHINYKRENMIIALPFIIEEAKKDGYTFVTLDKLLNQDPYFKP